MYPKGTRTKKTRNSIDKMIRRSKDDSDLNINNTSKTSQRIGPNITETICAIFFKFMINDWRMFLRA